MDKFKRYVMLFLAWSCLFSYSSCKPDELITYYAEEQEFSDEYGHWAEMALTLAPDLGEEGTKASLLKDVEMRGSGALVLVFRSDTRQLATTRYFRQEELDNQAQVALSLRVPVAVCDFYILGNLNAVRKSDGALVNLLEALGASFPTDENTLEAMSYRLDGGDWVSGFRRETFADVAVGGIPYALIKKNINTASLVGSGQGLPDANRCRRLFSKVTVSIDHGAFDGGGANPDYFVNSRLYLRQVNGRLQPFSDVPQKAQEAADMLAQSDYDPDMRSANASVTQFSFYVPENMQGTLLAGNTDSRRKSRDELIARNLGGVEPYLTYVEFCGHLNPAAGGFGGDVTYRFYLGRDNCSNFDLERGREYKIALSFRVGSIFEPDWRVTPDLTDSRLFALTADASFTTDIGAVNDTRLVVVRKSRPGACYLYMNPVGTMGGTNLLLGKEASTTMTFTPESLSDCSWYGPWMQAGTEDAAWLVDHGISASWEKASGRLVFTVTNASKFEARKTDPPRTFTLRLLPGGTVTTSFRLALYDDLNVSVSDGKSLTEEFYLGQKRTVNVAGFVGSTVKYAAVQPDCGGKRGNSMWKSSPSASAPFPGCRLDAGGRVVLDPADHAYDSQVFTGSLDLYAFYPNRFQPSHGYSSTDGKLVIFGKDWLNDCVEIPVRISEPYLKTSTNSADIVLPLDGTPQAVPEFGYMDYSGTSLLDIDSFDSTLYGNLLAFERTTSGAYAECIGVDPKTLTAYCRQTTYSGGGDLLALSYNDKGVTTLKEGRTVYLGANASTGLFSGRVFKQSAQYSKLVLGLVCGDGGSFTNYVSDDLTIRYLDYYRMNTYPYTTYNPLEEDGVFGFHFAYNFVGSDLARLSIDRNGPENTYTTSHGETFGPVFEIENEQSDSGNGGIMYWKYDESKQVSRDSYGEWVPGGILLPYGTQTLKFCYSNRWELSPRVFRVEKSFDFNFTAPHVLYVGAVQGRTAAQIFAVTSKQAKYLKRMPNTLSVAQRTQLVQWGGSYDYMSGLKVDRAYPYNSYSSYEYDFRNGPSSQKEMPLTGFMSKRVDNYKGGWTSSKVYNVLHGAIGYDIDTYEQMGSRWGAIGQHFSPATYNHHLVDLLSTATDPSYFPMFKSQFSVGTTGPEPVIEGTCLSSSDTWFANGIPNNGKH